MFETGLALLTEPNDTRSDGSVHAEAQAGTASVYSILAHHQREEEWVRRDLLSTLQEWSVRFVVEFELDVPKLALCVDCLPVSRLGHFRPGHNGFGLEGEIAINARYVGMLAEWEILGVLLHELLHAWQQRHGEPSGGNHHNEEFRRKARSLGLLIGRGGVTGYADSGPFRDLLRGRGVLMPDGEMPPRERRVQGNSKSSKWSCGCTNVRCATRLQATCHLCGQRFAPSRPSSNSMGPAGNATAVTAPTSVELTTPPHSL
jgi:hypothetical protein